MKTHIPSEFDIACAISEYITLQYPKIIFRMDLGGIRLPIGLAKKAKRLNPNRAWPDLMICEPRGKYYGLFLELKRNEDDLYTRGGSFRETKHIKEQKVVLRLLRTKGYQAEFTCGFEETKNLIDDYLDRRNT